MDLSVLVHSSFLHQLFSREKSNRIDRFLSSLLLVVLALTESLLLIGYVVLAWIVTRHTTMSSSHYLDSSYLLRQLLSIFALRSKKFRDMGMSASLLSIFFLRRS